MRKVFQGPIPWLYEGKIETDTGGKSKPQNPRTQASENSHTNVEKHHFLFKQHFFFFFFLMLFDFKLANPCLDEHVLRHNYSPLKISTVLQTSRKREFAGRGWATRHEMP